MTLSKLINPTNDEGVIVVSEEKLRGTVFHCVNDFEHTLEVRESNLQNTPVALYVNRGDVVIHLDRYRADALIATLQQLVKS